jgi:adenosylcobinamide-phosphate synthase
MWGGLYFLPATIALVAERLTGYPAPLQELVGHPVEWLGRLIAWLDTALNRPGATVAEGRLRGIVALCVLLVAAIIPAWVLAKIFGTFRLGLILDPVVATAFIAQTSLRTHVMDVHNALGNSLAAGRISVGKIVGRDPQDLDESGVVRAALESLAENTSDGVVAPAMWYALFGLPGIVLYKAINTADSMIGHRSGRYRDFGWAAARLDDLVNLPASRLTGLLFALAASKSFGHVLSVMRRDAPKHGSPNAGWPEAAMAAALNLRFGGPRAYHGEMVDLPWMGEGRETMVPADIRSGLRLYGRVLTWLAVVIFACAAAT